MAAVTGLASDGGAAEVGVVVAHRGSTPWWAWEADEALRLDTPTGDDGPGTPAEITVTDVVTAQPGTGE